MPPPLPAADRGPQPAGRAALPAAWLDPLPLPVSKSLPNHILPGPLEGLTAGSFVSVMTRRALVRCWITPFLRVSTGVPRRSRLQARLAPFLDTGLPVVAQLLGTDIAVLSGTAARLADVGVVGVDLNCACPAPMVVAHGGGGARLRTPQWIGDALAALRQACPDCGISVKLRSGYHDPAEMTAILAAVRAAAPDFVVLHFRTVVEGYRSVKDGWERLRRARELLPDVKLIASGDLFRPADALSVYRLAAVDGVAPARGLIANPWLLRGIEDMCRGRPATPQPLAARVGFLLDMVSAARRAGTSHRGFVVDCARYLFGTEHPLFAALAACRSLAAMADRLEAALRDAPDQEAGANSTVRPCPSALSPLP